MNPEIREYRSFLIEAEQAAQEHFDKTVLTLSAGAFGVSFAFVENVVGAAPQAVGWLLAAWIAWGASITAVIASFYFSTLSLRRAIEQVDAGSIHEETPGGFYTTITNVLNFAGGSLFFIGALLIVVFVAKNLL